MKDKKLSDNFDKNARRRSPLFSAVEDGDFLRVNRLLKQGAEVDAPSRTPRGLFAFMYRVPYPAGSTPLFVACLAGDYFIAGMLLDKKADPSHRNEKGETPLDAALCNLAFYRQKKEAAAHKNKTMRDLDEKIRDYEFTVETLLHAGAKPALFAVPPDLLPDPHTNKKGPSL